MPVESFLEFASKAKERQQDPAFVIRTAAETIPPGHGILGLLMQSCSTLGEACNTGYKLQHLTRTGLHSDLIFAPGTVASEIHTEPYNNESIANLVEYCQASLLGVINCLVLQGRKVAAKRVFFRHPPQMSKTEYHKVFGTQDIHFHQSKNIIEFDRKILDYPIERSDEGSKIALLKEAKQQVAKLLQKSSSADRLKQLMLEDHSLAGKNLGHYASLMNVNENTLKHKLKSELTSYSQVQFEVRQILAVQYLIDQDLSVDETATRLGYQSRSAFARSFKDWFDMSPLQYKQANQF